MPLSKITPGKIYVQTNATGDNRFIKVHAVFPNGMVTHSHIKNKFDVNSMGDVHASFVRPLTRQEKMSLAVLEL